MNAKLSGANTILIEHKKAHIMKPGVKLTQSKSLNVKSTPRSSSITHEEEKVALVLFLKAVFTTLVDVKIIFPVIKMTCIHEHTYEDERKLFYYLYRMWDNV